MTAGDVEALTGRADGPALVAPVEVIARIVELGEAAGANALDLLAERAAIGGLSRQGDHSCGGASRLLAARDGWMAVTLARDDDTELVPAWLEQEPPQHPWDAISNALAARDGAMLVERGRMLGLPIAMVGSVVAPRTGGDELPGHSGLPVLATQFASVGRDARFSPLVVDLSSLWAGPLCARLLGEAGADVVKVESVTRPDGARRGSREFFDRLHAGHSLVALDLSNAEGVDELRRLVAAADVVIEASRPRALARFGLVAEELLSGDGGPGVWISITGYGRTPPGRDWVAFGDDAAAAAGLVAWDAAGPCFFADAAADPLAGLTAAAAGRAALATGDRWLLDVAMSDVAAYVAGNNGEQPWAPRGS